MKLGRMCYCGWLALFLSMASLLGANPQIAQSSLTEEGRRIEAGYAKELEGLRSRITKRIPFVPLPTTEEARKKEFDFPEVELGGKKKSGDSSLEELLGDGKQPDPQVEESDPQKSFASFMLATNWTRFWSNMSCSWTLLRAVWRSMPSKAKNTRNGLSSCWRMPP